MKLPALLLTASLALHSLPTQAAFTAGALSIKASLEKIPNKESSENPEEVVSLAFTGPQTTDDNYAFVVATGSPSNPGSPSIPLEHQGSSVFLPFPAAELYMIRQDAEKNQTSLFKRYWKEFHWSDWEYLGGVPYKLPTETPSLQGLPARAHLNEGTLTFLIPSVKKTTRLAAWAKNLAADQGWGELVTSLSSSDPTGAGPITLRQYLEISQKDSQVLYQLKTKNDSNLSKIKIYQMLPRLFGNTNETRKQNGTLIENGVGKFKDLTPDALKEIKELGASHLWLTGVPQQATATDYKEIGEPADDPDLLKGIAGSPYAIRDLFDICPDYAENPSNRLEEFKQTIARTHQAGLKVLVDFVPNHVARSYNSNIRPQLSFGDKDDQTQFFHPKNNFFWLPPSNEGPPLQLPTKDSHPDADGLFPPETFVGRVTGDNAPTWKPNNKNWYETVKLNYGFDFTTFQRSFPNSQNSEVAIPNTWQKMDDALAYWQSLGVDGFRVDMAHMVPPEFWQWAIGRARNRNPETLFIAEAYNDSPYKVPSADPLSAHRGDVLFDLIVAGFDAVYDGGSYKALKFIFDGDNWANDLDKNHRAALVFDNAISYIENHDEVRVANKNHWGGLGSQVGKPTSALLYGKSRGPVLFYHGQEVGEPGNDKEGFGENDGRTTIFDYWSMPEFTKWVNNKQYDGGKLSEEQKKLRMFYQRLLHLLDEPAFRDGDFLPLNPHNTTNPLYGRGENETSSGKYLYSYLRHNRNSKQTYLVVVNLHPTKTLSNVHILFPPEYTKLLPPKPSLKFTEKLSLEEAPIKPLLAAPHQLPQTGLAIPAIAPLTPYYFLIE
jgi:glycosidase